MLTGDYWDGSLVLRLRRARAHRRARVAILGNAAGTTARAYEQFFPRTRVDGVEIDPELSEIGRRYFDMNNPRLHLYHEDARPFLRRIDARYDVITVDAYRQPYIPFYLTTRSSSRRCATASRPTACWSSTPATPRARTSFEKVLSATIGEAFPHVMRDPVKPTNTLIVASRAPRRRRLRATCGGCRRAAPAAAGTAGRTEPALRGGDVYTDDKAPVEWLIDKSIIDYAAGDD